MATNANIRNHISIIELQNALLSGADSCLKLIDSVNQYLNDVQETLQMQLDQLQRALETAECELEEAEAALSSCEASQKWDDEDNCYRPSCSSESRAVERARKEYERCKDRYDCGRDIKDQCDKTIEDYHFTGSILRSCGGEELLRRLAVDHTANANKKLNEILKVIDEYLAIRVAISLDNNEENSDSYPRNEKDQPLSNEDKERRWRDFGKRIDLQRYDGVSGIKKPNINYICGKCGRPSAACICKPDERIIEIINS